MLEQAIAKIRAEMGNAATGYPSVIGQYLLAHLAVHPDDAAKILPEDKTIKGSLSAMRKAASKHQTDGCSVLTDEEGFAEVARYFGLSKNKSVRNPIMPSRSAPDFDVKLDDFL